MAIPYSLKIEQIPWNKALWQRRRLDANIEQNIHRCNSLWTSTKNNNVDILSIEVILPSEFLHNLNQWLNWKNDKYVVTLEILIIRKKVLNSGSWHLRTCYYYKHDVFSRFVNRNNCYHGNDPKFTSSPITIEIEMFISWSIFWSCFNWTWKISIHSKNLN